MRWTGLSLLAGMLLAGPGGAVRTPAAADAVPGPPRSSSQPSQAPGALASAAIDLVVLDASNRPVATLTPAELKVTLDGEARAVAGLRYVVKGRGAVAAARALAAKSTLPVAADPSRVVILAVDQESFVPGAEKVVSSAVARVIDSLSGSDHVLLARLPQVEETLGASLDRGALRDGLARLAGRAATQNLAAAPSMFPPEPQPPVRQPDDEDPQRSRTGEQTVPHAANRPARGLDTPGVGPDQATGSVPALSRLVEGLRQLPGPKTIVVFSGGEATDGGAAAELAPRLTFSALADGAIAARAVVHAVHVPRAGPRPRDRDLERLAVLTGGRSVSVSGGARDLDPIDGAMAASYLVEVERRPGDERRLRGLRVTANRRGTTVLAASRWTARSDDWPPPLPAGPTPSEAVAAAVAAAPPPLPVASAGGRTRPRRVVRDDPELQAVLARASDYLVGYLREFSNVVAEEVYEQATNLGRPNSRNVQVRRLRSDLLLVQIPDRVGWMPFRDVFEVDGVVVGDREERLKKLFLEGKRTGFEQAMLVSEEGARHNLGDIRRTVNIPTLALEFLFAGASARCNWQRRGEDNVQGVRAWRIDFEEWGSPTVIKTDDGMADYPASGSIWVEPLTGRIVKTRVRGDDGKVSMESTVLFARNDVLGIWTPVEMKESYERATGTIGAEARYLNFRRFQVSTAEAVKVPK